MSYQKKNIWDVVQMIGKNELYLPAIQRKFVWEPEDIELLFDSIMRGYPIGTFLFWYVSGEKKNDYTFYKFLLNYHERDAYLNEPAPYPELRDEIVGVLDGQQRLSAIYLSLQGTYAYKNSGARWENDDAFPKRQLYLNLIFKASEYTTDSLLYEFKFLTESESKIIDSKHIWYCVKESLKWHDLPEDEEYFDSLIATEGMSEENKNIIQENKKNIKINLRLLYQRLIKDELLSYYKIVDQDLDRILDIFVRVNSGGKKLSKTDLLFSTVVANWQAGREEVEQFLEKINSKGKGFSFDNDFIMRCCLVLTDCPVLFKVDNFKKENIGKIREDWENIKNSVEQTVDIITTLGFSGETLTSQNAIVPIAYYYAKGGANKDSREIRRYLIHVLLKKTFGNHGDQVLTNLRECLRKKKGDNYVLANKKFSFESLLNTKLPGDRSMVIEDKDIQEMLDYRKGPYSFMVLSLLYPNFKYGQVEFHQDHIHPDKKFTKNELKKALIPESKWSKWQEIKDTLPNLQMMEGHENKSKQDEPLADWVNNVTNGQPNVPDIEKFKNDNFIPSAASLDFLEFDKFYEQRRILLEKEIRKLID